MMQVGHLVAVIRVLSPQVELRTLDNGYSVLDPSLGDEHNRVFLRDLEELRLYVGALLAGFNAALGMNCHQQHCKILELKAVQEVSSVDQS